MNGEFEHPTIAISSDTK